MLRPRLAIQQSQDLPTGGQLLGQAAHELVFAQASYRLSDAGVGQDVPCHGQDGEPLQALAELARVVGVGGQARLQLLHRLASPLGRHPAHGRWRAAVVPGGRFGRPPHGSLVEFAGSRSCGGELGGRWALGRARYGGGVQHREVGWRREVPPGVRRPVSSVSTATVKAAAERAGGLVHGAGRQTQLRGGVCCPSSKRAPGRPGPGPPYIGSRPHPLRGGACEPRPRRTPVRPAFLDPRLMPASGVPRDPGGSPPLPLPHCYCWCHLVTASGLSHRQ